MKEIKIKLPPEILVSLFDFLGNDPIPDTGGGAWEPVFDSGEITLRELSRWEVYIEGVFVGTGNDETPEEAIRKAFVAAGLTSLPEGVCVRASGPVRTMMIFTLDGTAYCVDQATFGDVEKSAKWTNARQAKRHEIDAMKRELAALTQRGRRR